MRPFNPPPPRLRVKEDLIGALRDAMDDVRGEYVSRTEAEHVLDMFITDIRFWLQSGDDVRIERLGTLKVHPGRARLITHEFGRPIRPHKVLAPRRHVTFRDSAELRRAMQD